MNHGCDRPKLCDTLENPHCSMAINIESNICSSSPVMATSPYEWKEFTSGMTPLQKKAGKQDTEPKISKLFIPLKNDNDIFKTSYSFAF